MQNLISQIKLYDPNQGKLKGLGALGDTDPSDSVIKFGKFLSSLVGIMSVVAIIWFLFLAISGGIGIISSNGDKNAVKTGVQKITNGMIGLVVVLVAVILVRLAGFFLGIEDGSLLDPEKWVDMLGFQ